MYVTITTHNRPIAHRAHNIRSEKVVAKEPHIDPKGHFEIWHDEEPRDAYKRIFGKYVEEYNERQQREDRKIKDYYKKICKDKKKNAVYEMIIGVYPKNGEMNRDMQKYILKEFVETWQERNPNLELIGAYYHEDEQGEPHVHIDYIPVAHGYTRGMRVQNGVVKALKEMGFEKKGKETAQIAWERRENKVLEGICADMCLHVVHPRKHREHLDIATYKAQQKLLTVNQEVDATYKELDAVKQDVRKNKQKGQEVIEACHKAEEYHDELIDQINSIHNMTEVNKELKIIKLEQENKKLRQRLKFVIDFIKERSASLYEEMENVLQRKRENEVNRGFEHKERQR